VCLISSGTQREAITRGLTPKASDAQRQGALPGAAPARFARNAAIAL
jgi:hypothetical protein